MGKQSLNDTSHYTVAQTLPGELFTSILPIEERMVLVGTALGAVICYWRPNTTLPFQRFEWVVGSDEPIRRFHLINNSSNPNGDSGMKWIVATVGDLGIHVWPLTSSLIDNPQQSENCKYILFHRSHTSSVCMRSFSLKFDNEWMFVCMSGSSNIGALPTIF